MIDPIFPWLLLMSLWPLNFALGIYWQSGAQMIADAEEL